MPPRSVSHPLDDVEYRSGPSILVFSDEKARLDWIAHMVTSEGGRISAALSVGETIGRIADHAAPDGVIADLQFASVAAVEGIFDALEEGARSRRFSSVALIHAGMIDLAAASAGHQDVQLLCAPDEASLTTAIRRLVTPRILTLADVGADHNTVRLRELSEEVSRIAQALAALSEHQQDRAGPAVRVYGAARPGPSVDASAIRAMIRARRMREQFFPADLFADPAWDMLLDLVASGLEGRPVAVSSLCIAAAVPPTTALRWIKTLTDLGMFIRVADPNDRRRVFIELAPEVTETMLECLSATRQATGIGI